MFSANRFAVMLFLAILLAVLVMMPGLRGGFFFDDNPNIVDNPSIRITTLNIESLKSSLNGVSAGPFGRPVSVLSFATTYYFFGLDATAFKAINLIIHLCNGFLLCWLIRLLIKNNFSFKNQDLFSIWVMTAWLVHPINFLPIMLAVQRMTLLATFFILLGLISHVKAINEDRHLKKILLMGVGWLIFWPLSILSKETGLLFPLYVILVTLFKDAANTNHTYKNNSRKSLWVAFISLLVIVALSFFLFGPKWLDTAYQLRSFSLTERLMTEARALWFYVAQIIAPYYSNFAVYHDDFLLSTGILQPISTLVSIVAWAVIVVTIIFAWARIPFICFSISWFLIGHFLESTFLPLEIMHEHRNYLPSVGLIMLIAYVAMQLQEKFNLIKKPKLLITAILIPIFALSFFTSMRANQLSNSLIGWQIEAMRHPQSARANYSAALVLFKAGYGDKDDSIGGDKIKTLFEKSSNADPAFKLGYIGLISWACASQREVPSSWIISLSDRLEHTTLDLSDRDLPKTLFDTLSNVPNCLSREDVDRLFVAGSMNPKIAAPQRAYFLEYAADYALFALKDAEAAKRYLLKALEITPRAAHLEQKLNTTDKMVVTPIIDSKAK